MLVKDDYSCHAWVYLFEHKSDPGDSFSTFLAHARADGVTSKVEIVRSDNGGGGSVVSLEKCGKRNCINQEFTNAGNPKQNGIVENARYHPEHGTRRVHPSAPSSFPTYNCRLLNPSGRKRCTGLVTH